MAEYRCGRFAEADAALLAADDRREEQGGRPGAQELAGPSAFFRAMSLFRQGKPEEARKLATEGAAKMVRLPKDEKNPLAGNATHDDLILWLPPRRRRPSIQFDAASAAPATRDGK